MIHTYHDTYRLKIELLDKGSDCYLLYYDKFCCACVVYSCVYHITVCLHGSIMWFEKKCQCGNALSANVCAANIYENRCV